jgi:hypothetical protein
MERTCQKCGETKPIEEFDKNKNRSYGYTNTCKKCRTITQKKYRETHREKIKEDNKKYPYRIWRAKNKDHCNEYAKKYRESHVEQIKKI